MNIPMSIQADALQVMLPKATADYTAIWISAGATVVGTLIGVILGYVISEWQRKKIEKKKDLDQLVYNLRYTLGFLRMQNNAVGLWLNAFNVSVEDVLSQNSIKKVDSIVRFEVDYHALSQLLHFFPNITVKVSDCITGINSLNFCLTKFYDSYDKTELEHAVIYDEVMQLLDGGIEIVEALIQLNANIYEEGRKEVIQNLGRSFNSQSASCYEFIGSLENDGLLGVVEDANRLCNEIEKLSEKAPQ